METIQNKRFISDEHNEFSSISWHITSGWGEGQKKKHTKCSDLRLSDCYKVISLDFDYEGHDQFLSRIKKIDCLIEELQKYKQALKDSWGKE